MTVWKPRGPQKPARQAFEGIRVNQLVQFCNDAKHCAQQHEDMDVAVAFEILAEYFEKDYKIGEPLRFKSQAIGY